MSEDAAAEAGRQALWLLEAMLVQLRHVGVDGSPYLEQVEGIRAELRGIVSRLHEGQS